MGELAKKRLGNTGLTEHAPRALKEFIMR